MDLSFASKAAQAKAQIADALKRLPPAPQPGAPVGPLGAPPAPVPPQGGPQAPQPPAAPLTPPASPPASPLAQSAPAQTATSPLAVMGMQPQPQPASQAPNLAVPRAFARGGRVSNQTRSLAVQFKGN